MTCLVDAALLGVESTVEPAECGEEAMAMGISARRETGAFAGKPGDDVVSAGDESRRHQPSAPPASPAQIGSSILNEAEEFICGRRETEVVRANAAEKLQAPLPTFAREPR
jgi:hypothetical protein